MPTPAPTFAVARVKGALAVTMSAEAVDAVAAAFADESTRAAVRTAFASSIADGLKVDAELVTILSIAVASVDGSRRSRRLQDASVEVEFEVEQPFPADAGATADAPVVSIANLDVKAFSSALTSSLADAPGLESLPAVEVIGVVAEEVG